MTVGAPSEFPEFRMGLTAKSLANQCKSGLLLRFVETFLPPFVS
jgi:hypothetical protein